MKTPSLEEVRAYFKDAKEVRCLIERNIGIINVEEIRWNGLDGFFQQPGNGNNWLILYKDSKYAEIISYKDKIDESAKANQSVKQYKHIPTGKIAEKIKEATDCYFIEDIYLPNWLIENSSDWEEVKPKEYEILKVKLPSSGIVINASESDGTADNYLIHSVKRLSDGEVFTVGDFCSPIGKYENNIHQITKIWICDPGWLRLSSENYTLGIDDIQKAKNPVLFTTEDGVEIRKGDKFYVVDEQYGKFKTHDTIGGHFTKEHKHRKRFSSKEKASEYVLMNKPCLSVNDVLGKLNFAYDSIFYKNFFVELAKSKINS